MEKNILLTIEYDGTNFHGWQRQNELRTVQGTLEAALSRVCGGPVTIEGTSRTDAGVHALGQRATLRGEFGIPVDRIPIAVNHILAGDHRGDVRILRAEEMPEGFHARFSCIGKKYRYLIRNAEDMPVFLRNYRYLVEKPLDADAMAEAAGRIVGKQDFQCFQATGSYERETTVRTVHSCTVTRDGSDVIIEIAGDGFLYNMVRIITGTLVETGLGKRTPEEMKETIASGDRTKAGHTAPPQGLYLAEVYYEAFGGQNGIFRG